MATAAVLFLILHAAALAAEPKRALPCAPLTTADIPADYLFYHALVTPHPPTRPQSGEASRLQASCTPHKVVRT